MCIPYAVDSQLEIVIGLVMKLRKKWRKLPAAVQDLENKILRGVLSALFPGWRAQPKPAPIRPNWVSLCPPCAIQFGLVRATKYGGMSAV